MESESHKQMQKVIDIGSKITFNESAALHVPSFCTFIVLEELGPNLFRFIKNRQFGNDSVCYDALKITISVIEAIEEIHSLGLVHG